MPDRRVQRTQLNVPPTSPTSSIAWTTNGCPSCCAAVSDMPTVVLTELTLVRATVAVQRLADVDRWSGWLALLPDSIGTTTSGHPRISRIRTWEPLPPVGVHHLGTWPSDTPAPVRIRSSELESGCFVVGAGNVVPDLRNVALWADFLGWRIAQWQSSLTPGRFEMVVHTPHTTADRIRREVNWLCGARLSAEVTPAVYTLNTSYRTGL
jgi:hypothetical protein